MAHSAQRVVGNTCISRIETGDHTDTLKSAQRDAKPARWL